MRSFQIMYALRQPRQPRINENPHILHEEKRNAPKKYEFEKVKKNSTDLIY